MGRILADVPDPGAITVSRRRRNPPGGGAHVVPRHAPGARVATGNGSTRRWGRVNVAEVDVLAAPVAVSPIRMLVAVKASAAGSRIDAAPFGTPSSDRGPRMKSEAKARFLSVAPSTSASGGRGGVRRSVIWSAPLSLTCGSRVKAT